MTKRSGRRSTKKVTPRLPPNLQRQVDRRAALKVLSLMRTKGKSLTAAIKEAETKRAIVDRYVGSALVKGVNRRYRAKASDRFARELHFLTPEGRISITVRGSRTASKIAEYSAAVDRYLNTGDTAQLDKYRGKSVRAGKLKLSFLTDPKILDRLANAEQVGFEDLYAITI
jgi:hypothetical protein